MYKNRSSADISPEQQQTEPVKREYVTAMHRRAKKLADDSTQSGHKGTLASHIHREQQQIEQEMAQLRTRAVQARRLAEHIEGLSRSASPPEWAETSTSATDVHSAQTETRIRRKDDVSAGSPGQRSFNPLHPSMELPPEQLIRLLKLHTRKTRKHKKHIKSQQPDLVTPTSPNPISVDTPQTTGTASKAGTTLTPPAFDEPRRRGLLLPSTIAGILLGGLVSAWLFLDPQDKTQPTASTTVTKQLQPPSVPPVRKTVPANPAAPVTKLATATSPAPQAIQPPAAAEKSTPASGQSPDSEWREAILEEQKRLYREAQQRFSAQLQSVATTWEKPVPAIEAVNMAEVETALAETTATDAVPAEEAILEQVVVHYSVTGSASVPEDTPAPDSPASVPTDSASAAEAAGPDSAW